MPNHAHIDRKVQRALRNWPWLGRPVGIGGGGVAYKAVWWGMRLASLLTHSFTYFLFSCVLY